MRKQNIITKINKITCDRDESARSTEQQTDITLISKRESTRDCLRLETFSQSAALTLADAR